MPFIVSIESCAGAGKGFLLKHIMQNGLPWFSTHVYLQDDSIDQVLDYNKDPRRWILTKELHFLFNHVKALGGGESADVVLVEGSPVSDRLCFFDASCSHPLERQLYQEWYDLMRPHWKVDLHIVLVSSPHDCLDRIIGNSKKEQASANLSQICKQMNTYTKTFSELATVEEIVCLPNFEDNEPAIEIMKNQLCELIHKHYVQNT